MNTQFVRKAFYLAVSTLLIVFSMALVMTSFNIQTAYAAPATQIGEGGGGPATIGDEISMELGAKHIVTIRTTTKANNIDTYVVHPQVNSDYYAAKLGIDYICVIKAGDTKQTQICIPFTAIATVSFRSN